MRKSVRECTHMSVGVGTTIRLRVDSKLTPTRKDRALIGQMVSRGMLVSYLRSRALRYIMSVSYSRSIAVPGDRRWLVGTYGRFVDTTRVQGLL